MLECVGVKLKPCKPELKNHLENIGVNEATAATVVVAQKHLCPITWNQPGIMRRF